MLSSEQQQCLDVVIEGHNLGVFGQAGTGKTYLAKQMQVHLVGMNKNVAITTSTGIAGKQYEFRSKTLHSWSGIKDGHLRGEQLFKSINNGAVNNIKHTDCLIIDEISMISKYTLEQVNHVCQAVRHNQLPMGGIQTIVIGDYYQLAPVPNRWNQDDGQFAFESNIWKSLIPHKIILTNIFRQNDPQFIKVINETARGCPSQQSCSIINSLNSQTPRHVTLFATRSDTFIFNVEQLKQFPGDMTLYKSVEGQNVSGKMRKTVDAPAELALKVGAPVILTVNISHRLVNGLSGVVKQLNHDSVQVYFPYLKESHDIEGHDYFVYNFKTKRSVFVVKQIPLLLSFGMTIHKSQGMTLDSVRVDCQGAFAPGQISVALGRVTDSKYITVTNFRPSLCPPHPPCIGAFCGLHDEERVMDISCCRHETASEFETCVTKLSDDSEGEDDEIDDVDGDNENDNLYLQQDINDVDNVDEVIYPTNFTAEMLRQRLSFNYIFTKTQQLINDCIAAVSDDRLLRWSKSLYARLSAISGTIIHKPGDTKQINSVVHAFVNEYSKSDEFYNSLKSVFEIGSLQQHHLNIGITALLRIQDWFFSYKSETEKNNASKDTPITDDAKIRYVAGVCVGRYLNRNTKYVCRNAHKEDEDVNGRKVSVNTIKKHLFNSVDIAKAETQYPDTLSEINFRQTKFGHLTIVDDYLMKIFIEFDHLIFPHLTSNALKEEGDALFETVLSETMESLFYDSNVDIPADITPSLMKPVLSTYLRISVKELGFRLVTQLNVKRKWAHRKQVLLEAGEGSTKKGKFDTTDSISPQPGTSGYTIQTNPESTTELSTPTTQDTSANPEDDICVQCRKTYAKTKRWLWIECSNCSQWRHRVCDSFLKPPKVWKQMSHPEAHYSCPACRKQGDSSSSI